MDFLCASFLQWFRVAWGWSALGQQRLSGADPCSKAVQMKNLRIHAERVRTVMEMEKRSRLEREVRQQSDCRNGGNGKAKKPVQDLEESNMT